MSHTNVGQRGMTGGQEGNNYNNLRAMAWSVTFLTPFRRATGLRHAPMRKYAGYSGVAPDVRLQIRHRFLLMSHTMSHTWVLEESRVSEARRYVSVPVNATTPTLVLRMRRSAHTLYLVGTSPGPRAKTGYTHD